MRSPDPLQHLLPERHGHNAAWYTCSRLELCYRCNSTCHWIHTMMSGCNHPVRNTDIRTDVYLDRRLRHHAIWRHHCELRSLCWTSRCESLVASSFYTEMSRSAYLQRDCSAVKHICVLLFASVLPVLPTMRSDRHRTAPLFNPFVLPMFCAHRRVLEGGG